jgi:DNA invertase Pin-like site-specific DNA recombinase
LALDAIAAGDTLVITTLDRLGRSTLTMLAFADDLRARGAGLRVLNLGGGDGAEDPSRASRFSDYVSVT